MSKASNLPPNRGLWMDDEHWKTNTGGSRELYGPQVWLTYRRRLETRRMGCQITGTAGMIMTVAETTVPVMTCDTKNFVSKILVV